MEQALVQRLREVLGDLPPEDVYAIIAFAQFLSERRQVAREAASKAELAEVEHTRVLRVLDAVAALSSEANTGPPVSNRDHDRYLYGKDCWLCLSTPVPGLRTLSAVTQIIGPPQHGCGGTDNPW